MRKIIKNFESIQLQKLRHIALRVGIVVFLAFVVWRFVSFGLEQNMFVFNMTRDALVNGAPVSAIEMKKTDGVIYEPLFINSNRGYVSGMRVARFSSGQKISGGGEIVSVSKSIDLDSGMHVVRTRGAKDGEHMVEIRENGFYVPTYAVQNGYVFVVKDDAAHSVAIDVVRGDSKNTLIKGVTEGDVVITSHAIDGQKVKIVK